MDRIDAQYSAANLRFPTLDDPFNPDGPADDLLGRPSVVEQARLIVGVADQLSVMVTNPSSGLMEVGMAYCKSACLRVAMDGNVPEILREAGPKGLHANDIASKNGMEPKKLSRILRLLATYHIFKELKPNVYANNRISLVLDTQKPVSGLSCPPNGDKYVGSNGVAAILLHVTDEVMKGGAFLSEHLIDPVTGHADDPTMTPLSRVFNMREPMFNWICRPGNETLRARFQAGMTSIRFAEDITTPSAFPWQTLAPGSVIVDVGGGVGLVSWEIAKKFPKLKFVVQDLGDVTEQAKGFWEEHMPGSIESGMVTFQAYDFFKPQPVKNADVFVLRAIAHDWPTSHAIKILKRVREAAVPGKSKLLIMDSVPNYACRSMPEGVEEIVGIENLAPVVPDEVLPNLGRGSGWNTLLDMVMLCSLQGQERMIGDQMDMCKAAGWKITHLYSPKSPVYRQLLAVPI